ncbi:uncharacterized protein TRAVEDRAFT_41981 [Trametes versicolor FP-101664 SS1]|uniref:uncharacterized protein n=1 Tax=Trametes versicolor (strain FP-101664) TaxID=717944 RepID=UPI0004622361|nr:uncharacterized protein TRAVEDRAFT_41981 [Trametes versicolor FP-101664 SS1]EIW64571.1 hypothetical protein TRAVEDRAFT_41981 [Trametes versicolor FP-101664 SS1]
MHPSPSTETDSARMETSDVSRVLGRRLQFSTAPVLREYVWDASRSPKSLYGNTTIVICILPSTLSVQRSHE